MQPSKPVGWGRVVTPLRWIARLGAGIPYVLWAGFSLSYNSGGGLDVQQWVILGILAVGLVLAVFWKGIGEIAGGLLLLGGGIGQGFLYLPPQLGAMAAGAVFAVPGILFIAAGWYTLMHQRPHTHAPA